VIVFVSDERRRRWSWLAVGLIVVATLVAYRGVIANGFVLDDHHTIEHNPAVGSWSSAADWLTSPHATSGIREQVNYRPVLTASYAVDDAVWGGRPAGFHATNLAIHLGVVLLAFLLARRLWDDEAAAVCAAGLVALHPLNAEAVNYLTARSSSLSTLFVLAAVWTCDRAGDGSRRAWTVAAYGFGLAALGTKEIAVVLPVLMIIWDRARRGGVPWSDTVRRSVPWWVLVGGFLVVRAIVLWGHTGSGISGPGATTGQGILFAIKIYLASLGHWFWPTGLAVDHAWPILIGSHEGALLAAGAVAAGTVTIALAMIHRPTGWCLAWFWIAMAPVGALAFTSRFTLYQDNRVYLAGIALAWLAGRLLAPAARRGGPIVRVALGIALIVGVVSAVRADASRTTVWADGTSLWEDVLSTYPSSPMAHNARGVRLLNGGRLAEARASFEQALRLMPGFATAHKNLGLVFANQEDWDRAIAAFQFALDIDPRYDEAWMNLGKVYERIGRPDLALGVYDRLAAYDAGETSMQAREALRRLAAPAPEARAGGERR
jgi:hypothetical protein